MQVSAQIIIEPIITEKSSTARQDGKYVFRVNEMATKIDIANAVHRLFKVKVIKVNTVKIPAKARRLGKFEGKISSYTKAYVKLAAGQNIPELEGTSQ